MPRNIYGTRHTVLRVLVAVLVVTAGCSSLVSDNSRPTETPDTPSNTLPDDGINLRNITIPDNGSTSADGEIDGTDPVLASTGAHYEPVQFTADAGTSVNITVISDSGVPQLYLRAPNGTTVATDSTDGNSAGFKLLELERSGQYTLIAAATDDRSGFEYTLTVERYIEPDFNGPPSSWDEKSRYLEFATDYGLVAQNTSSGNITAINRTANTDDDYIVFTYEMDPNATLYERLSVDNALQISYWFMYEEYAADDGDFNNESWVPERIYHRAITPEGDFYRSTYITLEWARDYGETGDPQLFQARYWETLRYGPAHQEYVEGGNRSTSASAFPEETYGNVTVNLTTRRRSP